MKKIITKLTIALAALIMAFGFTSCGTSYYGASGDGYYDNYYDYNPVWAPDYYWGTRYYYFPDIETYYDLATRNFVYLYNGQWIFVRSLPAIYSAFNLHNAFIVIVNRNVYNPWMHHQFYNSHYPRYYYIDYYDFSNIPYVRGYNENGRRAVYWKDSEKDRAREWGDRSLRERRDFRYSSDDRRVQQEVTRRISQRAATSPSDVRQIGKADEGRINHRNEYPATNRTNSVSRTPGNATRQTTANTQRTSVNRSEETNYYGGSIGQPVRVKPQMRENTGGRTSTNTRSSSGTSRDSSGGTTSTRSSGGRK